MIFKLFLNDLNKILSEIYEKTINYDEKEKKFRLLLLQKMQLGTAKRRVTSLHGSNMSCGLIRFIFGVWTTKNLLVRYSIP